MSVRDGLTWNPGIASTLERGPKRPIHKICFCLHLAELVNHYRNIWENLPREDFVVLFACADPLENERIASFAADHGYESIFVADALRRGDFFSVVVSNHIAAVGLQRDLLSLGKTQVRLMYSLGKAVWNYSRWNRRYHTILCFGPYHTEGLSVYPNVRKIAVGYPRFDDFFLGRLDRGAILESLRCDPSKKTVVWLPTWSKLSSIERYADIVSQLKGLYNVVVKVHPETLLSEPSRIELLRQHGILPIENSTYDNVKLFYIADYVLADYGGSIFGAIYTDRNVLLLNVPDAAQDSLTGSESLDIRVREELLSVEPDDRFSIPDLLEDDGIWDNQRPVRARISDRIITPNRGNASVIAADAIRQLLVASRARQWSLKLSAWLANFRRQKREMPKAT